MRRKGGRGGHPGRMGKTSVRSEQRHTRRGVHFRKDSEITGAVFITCITSLVLAIFKIATELFHRQNCFQVLDICTP